MFVIPELVGSAAAAGTAKCVLVVYGRTNEQSVEAS
jgi:hypothetical protein